MEDKSRFSWLMVLCCVIPMVLVIFFLAGGIGSLSGANFKLPSGSWLILLLCPLMHIGMMLFMKRGCHGNDGNQNKSDNEKTTPHGSNNCH